MLTSDYVVMSTACAIDLEDYQRRELAERVAATIASVRRRGDVALLGGLADGAGIAVTPAEIEACVRSLGPAALEDLRAVQDQERRLAQAQRAEVVDFESDWLGDARVGVRHVPFRSTGLCVSDRDGASPSLFTMQAAVIAARVAGVKRIVACIGGVPGELRGPRALLVAALALAGADELYRASGPAGLAALTVGTESVAPVDLPLGIGDASLSEAQCQLSAARRDRRSGLVLIADESADAELVAADLIAATELGPRARAVLITTSPALAATVATAAEGQLRSFACPQAASHAWSRARALHVVDDREAACALANRHPLERVEVMAVEPRWFLPRLHRASEVFLGARAGIPFADAPDRSSLVHPLAEHRPLATTGFLRSITYREARPGAASRRAAALARHLRAAELGARARTREARVDGQLAGPGQPVLAAFPLA